MARSHHRKKHKEHVQQFKHRGDFVAAAKTKGKASWTFLIIGVIVGILLGYFASNGAVGWMAIGLAAGGAAGYFIGRRVDGSK
jgi:hypothetical protein